MKIYDAVEMQIQAAIKRGDPERLTNKGKPLDFEAWKRTPEHLRMGYSILRNAGVKPPEIELNEQINQLKQAISKLDKVKDAEARTCLVNKMNSLLVTRNIKMERLRRR